MEEKVVGGKEKKYVLYTVVGEERGRAGAGVWVVRVLLGTLLLVALAVVPYLSLRLAQVSDRTLVVFQPVPMRNHSLHHHNGNHHVVEHGKLGHVDVVSILQSASLSLENSTTTKNSSLKLLSSNSSSSNNNSKSSNSSNGASGIVTLHESAVTLSVMEDTNATKRRDNNTDGDDAEREEDHSDKTVLEEAEESATTEDTTGTSEAPASITQVAVMMVNSSLATPLASVDNTTGSTYTTAAPHSESNVTSATSDVTTPAVSSVATSAPMPKTSGKTPKKVSTVKVANASSNPSTAAPNTTASSSTSTSSTTHHPLSHKLVYVATTASGNHIGGFCVWKTGKNITRWSYFYENIPIEYQSHQDAADHEMRGMLAAVRTWAPLWNDHHVVLRSHNPSIERSNHPTRRVLIRELEMLSEGRFSYELEWRLRKTDRVIDVAYCLARLHRDYAHWYRTFQARVDELLGQQDWNVSRTQNRASVAQKAFLTDDPEDEGLIIPGDK
ncbi:hypothetical protein SK128_027711 [Halocaridina rubra]|uniref:Uncharacterized protein n=1 Tax=Halocaridina rubra TaxID=373956 RepID=A0AAN9A2P3_HALRR